MLNAGGDERPALVLCNTPSDDALRIARVVVERHLAACVNVVPGVVSVYRWEGVIHEDRESTLLVKTTFDRVPALTAAIREVHPYTVPEVVAIAIEPGVGNADYLEWLRAETRAGGAGA